MLWILVLLITTYCSSYFIETGFCSCNLAQLLCCIAPAKTRLLGWQSYCWDSFCQIKDNSYLPFLSCLTWSELQAEEQPYRNNEVITDVAAIALKMNLCVSLSIVADLSFRWKIMISLSTSKMKVVLYLTDFSSMHVSRRGSLITRWELRLHQVFVIHTCQSRL